VPTAVKAGDRVLLPGWGGNSIKVGEEVRVCLFFLVVVVLFGLSFFLCCCVIGILLVQGFGNFGQD